MHTIKLLLLFIIIFVRFVQLLDLAVHPISLLYDIPVYEYATIFLIHFPVDEHLCCSQFEVIFKPWQYKIFYSHLLIQTCRRFSREYIRKGITILQLFLTMSVILLPKIFTIKPYTLDSCSTLFFYFISCLPLVVQMSSYSFNLNFFNNKWAWSAFYLTTDHSDFLLSLYTSFLPIFLLKCLVFLINL